MAFPLQNTTPISRKMFLSCSKVAKPTLLTGKALVERICIQLGLRKLTLLLSSFPVKAEASPLSDFEELAAGEKRIAPNLCKQSRKIWQSVRDFRDPDGYLSHVKSHFFSHAVHLPSDTQYHKDQESCWSCFDAIAVFGKYEGGELHFPELGYFFPSHPSDLFFIRGATFEHDAGGWEGDGRMVFAMFSDKGVFYQDCETHPQDLEPIYGKAHSSFQATHCPSSSPISTSTASGSQPISNDQRKGKTGSSRAAMQRLKREHSVDGSMDQETQFAAKCRCKL
ncbi:uncharacterized protein EI90DRAFT_3016929 [Cantharellus anzutake]|uniref:uncharacterized protein n=1 Tax=Cantharellus anzutake TaxID=1750568 RepID=UPI001904901A|nr:uncharacterized protein EI90DRAFT_3016929 [Cantharellus anzutake]KAF8329970.1 hypothetical protein EI90DRAFT_3016929 [Cantharellus anzutake]